MNATAKPRTRVKAGSAPLRFGVSALAASAPRTPVVTPWQIARPAPGVLPADGMAMDIDGGLSALYGYAGQTYGATNPYGEGLAFLGYPYLSELAQRPEYRRMVGTLAQEMTRKWVRLTAAGGDDKADRIAALTEAMEKFRVRDVFREAAEHDGFFGRGQIYIDTGDGDDRNELRTPLLVKRAKIGRGGLKRIKAVEAIWTYPGVYGSNDPLATNFYRPTTWYVMGKEVHHTRLLTLISREVPDLLKPAYMFGGISLTQLAKPYVDNWLRTRQSVSDLLHSFTVWLIKTDLAALLAGEGAASLENRIDGFVRFRDNRGVAVTDKDREEISNVSAPLSGLHELQAQSQEHMASVDGMPLIKLLGITPSGLNATGEGEMDAWRDRVRAQQEHLFNAPLKRVMDIIQLSEFGDIDPDIGFEWEPLEEVNPVERATVRKTEADTAAVLIDKGVISPEEERQRLATEDGSAYANLDLSVEITPPADPSLEPNPFGPDDDGQSTPPAADVDPNISRLEVVN